MLNLLQTLLSLLEALLPLFHKPELEKLVDEKKLIEAEAQDERKAGRPDPGFFERRGL